MRTALPRPGEPQAGEIEGRGNFYSGYTGVRPEWITEKKLNFLLPLGFNGTGIVVGNQDTGMRWSHNALKPHYRGWNGSSADHNFNWHDATERPSSCLRLPPN